MKFVPLSLLTLSVLAPFSQAHADHPPGYPPTYPPTYPGSSVQRLVQDANQLNSLVQNRPRLGLGVREATARFTSEVAQLSRCVSGGVVPPRPYPPYPGPGPVPRPYPGACQFELRDVVATFGEVERYLYDTQYEFPNVHQLYLIVRQDLEQVKRELGQGGGNPPPYVLRAQGSLDHVPFQLSGDRIQINRQCMDLGYGYRLDYVRGVLVNGRRFGDGYGRFMTLSEACTIVAQEAR